MTDRHVPIPIIRTTREQHGTSEHHSGRHGQPADPVASAPERERVCDLGYLRAAYARPDGKLGYRCAAELVKAYVEKGGAESDTAGRRCLCNALMANVGHAQIRGEGRVEQPLLTSGDDLVGIGAFLDGRTSYSANDVLDYLEGR